MAQVPIDDVHQALLVLYVPAELASTNLAALLPVCRSVDDTVERAQLLRGRLLDAIEMMRPASHAAPSATAARAYDCLRLRYVSGLRVDEVARQLAVSPRQVYRDLGWAEEQLAHLMESDCSPAEGLSPAAIVSARWKGSPDLCTAGSHSRADSVERRCHGAHCAAQGTPSASVT